jgi:hypothetical protein
VVLISSGAVVTTAVANRTLIAEEREFLSLRRVSDLRSLDKERRVESGVQVV